MKYVLPKTMTSNMLGCALLVSHGGAVAMNMKCANIYVAAV